MSTLPTLGRRELLTSAAAMMAASALGLPARAIAQALPAPIVHTTNGLVSGVLENGTPAYKGIPYGEDTGGVNRFLPPVAKAPWNGIYDASGYGPACPQLPAVIGDRRTSEDCLRLNVWTPSVSGKRPVMVWLHGGAYHIGSDNYAAEGADGAAAAARHDYVFVSLTHRLNVFGFLQLGPEFGEKYADSGNVGLLDIAAALTWVKANIARFGGDPNNVTIAGTSGGGSKVMHAMAMPVFNGLFHHAIVFSGHDLWKRNSNAAARRASRAVLNSLGLRSVDLKALQSMSTEQLLTGFRIAGRGYTADPAWGAPGWVRYDFLSPNIDGMRLPMYPMDAIAAGASADVDLIVGTDEWTHWTAGRPDNYGQMTKDDLVKALQPYLGDRALSVVGDYQKLLPGASPSSLLGLIVTDRDWWIADVHLAEAKYLGGGKPAYMYFNTTGTVSHRYAAGGAGQTAFGVGISGQFESTFANFAATGNPNGPLAVIPKWDTYRPGTRSVMLFDYDVRQVNDLYSKRRQLLRELRPGFGSFGP